MIYVVYLISPCSQGWDWDEGSRLLPTAWNLRRCPTNTRLMLAWPWPWMPPSVYSQCLTHVTPIPDLLIATLWGQDHQLPSSQMRKQWLLRMSILLHLNPGSVDTQVWALTPWTCISALVDASSKVLGFFCRLFQVSKAAADLMAYCEAHAKEDPLLTPVPASENPFREKKFFCAIL